MVKKHRTDRNFARLEWRIDTTQKELLSIANELLSRNKDSNTAKFILRTACKVTLFAELTSRGIQIPDNNNHALKPYENRWAENKKESPVMGR